jgi:ABC-type polysaccharide transport system permease subunit
VHKKKVLLYERCTFHQLTFEYVSITVIAFSAFQFIDSFIVGTTVGFRQFACCHQQNCRKRKIEALNAFGEPGCLR